MNAIFWIKLAYLIGFLGFVFLSAVIYVVHTSLVKALSDIAILKTIQHEQKKDIMKCMIDNQSNQHKQSEPMWRRSAYSTPCKNTCTCNEEDKEDVKDNGVSASKLGK